MDDALFKTNEQKQLLGEALFLRLTYYHELPRFFEQYPLNSTIAGQKPHQEHLLCNKVYAHQSMTLIEAACSKKSD